MAATDCDEATFEAHRPLLFSIAYRMLGSASEAEDVVQDAWLRARQDEHADVRSPRAYLTTIVTRLSIDHLRSAERTRMEVSRSMAARTVGRTESGIGRAGVVPDDGVPRTAGAAGADRAR